MKTIFCFVIIGLISISSFAQEFEIPKDIKLKTTSDFITLEKDIVNAVDWLINTPLDEQKGKRTQVNAFVMQWLSGTPTVTLEIKSDIVTFMDCADCLMIYMGAYAKNAIENKESTKLLNNIAAIKTIILFYTKNKSTIGKNKAIEKYIKLKNKGKLEKYLKSKV